MKMRTFFQGKMWRDKAIDLLEAQGSIITWRLLSDSEYDEQLRLKMIEEVNEVQAALSRTLLVEELADVADVLEALCALHGISRDEIRAMQDKKCASRGGFSSRKFVELATHPVGSFGEQYCLADLQKYPEIITE